MFQVSYLLLLPETDRKNAEKPSEPALAKRAVQMTTNWSSLFSENKEKSFSLLSSAKSTEANTKATATTAFSFNFQKDKAQKQEKTPTQRFAPNRRPKAATVAPMRAVNDKHVKFTRDANNLPLSGDTGAEISLASAAASFFCGGAANSTATTAKRSRTDVSWNEKRTKLKRDYKSQAKLARKAKSGLTGRRRG